MLKALEVEKHDRDTEIRLLQEDKYQLEFRIMDLNKEQSNLEDESEKKLSALQCELDELKAEYEKLADDSIKRISDLTDKHEKKIEHLKDVFLKEKEELVMENKTYKASESETKAKMNEMERKNFFLVEELRDVHIRYKDVGIFYM